jgi:hypothetical protein
VRQVWLAPLRPTRRAPVLTVRAPQIANHRRPTGPLALGASLLRNAERRLVDRAHAALVSRSTPNAPQITGPPSYAALQCCLVARSAAASSPPRWPVASTHASAKPSPRLRLASRLRRTSPALVHFAAALATAVGSKFVSVFTAVGIPADVSCKMQLWLPCRASGASLTRRARRARRLLSTESRPFRRSGGSLDHLPGEADACGMPNQTDLLLNR